MRITDFLVAGRDAGWTSRSGFTRFVSEILGIDGTDFVEHIWGSTSRHRGGEA